MLNFRLIGKLLLKAEASKRKLGMLIFLSLLSPVFIVGTAFWLARIIDAVLFQAQTLQDVAAWIGFLAAFMFLRAGVSFWRSALARQLAEEVKTNIRRKLTVKLLSVRADYCEQNAAGNLVHLYTDGVEKLDDWIANFLPGVLQAGLVPLLIGFVIYYYDGTAALLLLFTAPLLPLFLYLIGSKAGEKSREQWNVLGRFSGHFLDLLKGMATLKWFGQSSKQRQVIESLSEEFRISSLAVLKIAFLSAFILELAATLSTAVIAVMVGLKLLYGYLDFWSAFFILLLTPEFYQPLRLLGSYFHSSVSGKDAAEEIFNFLAYPESLQGRMLLPDQPLTVEFRQVSFAYNPNMQVLNEVSFTLAAHASAALIGISGSGKSTIAALLMQWLVPDSGQILINGVDLKTLNKKSWFEAIGYLPQEPYLPTGTLQAYFRLAKGNVPDSAIEAALHEVQLSNWYRALPQGLDTMLGDGGRQVSGGEKQRLALARLLVQNPKLLILDEPTAHLDPELAEIVQTCLKRVMPGRTVLIIAHRFSTLKLVDQVIELNSDSIVSNASKAFGEAAAWEH